VLLMMEQGRHLSPEGLEQIRRIAGQMNRGAQEKVRPGGKPSG